MRPLQKTSEYKGPEPPAWTLPGLVSGAVRAAKDTASMAGYYPDERAQALRKEAEEEEALKQEIRMEVKAEEERERFSDLADKAKALRDAAKTEPQRELASQLLIASRTGIGGDTDAAIKMLAQAEKRYSEVI